MLQGHYEEYNEEYEYLIRIEKKVYRKKNVIDNIYTMVLSYFFSVLEP